MKKITILVLAYLLSITSSFAGEGSDPEINQIRFFEGSWQSAMDLAKQEGKPIFLDVYATWCGPCKLLQSKTFTDAKVASYFNSHFINVSLDAERGDGIAVAKSFKVTALPTLFILSPDGEVLQFTKGFKYPDELIELGKLGLEDFKNSSASD